jgi:hypothetical protein
MNNSIGGEFKCPDLTLNPIRPIGVPASFYARKIAVRSFGL